MNATAPTEEKSFWLQEAVFDLLPHGARYQDNCSALYVTYAALAAIADETDAAPCPSHDGRPFETKVIRIARMVCQSCEDTARRLKRFARLGLIDPVNVPSDPIETITIRLRLLPQTEKGPQP